MSRLPGGRVVGRVGLAVLLACAALITSCQSAHMPLPGSLEQVPEARCSGRQGFTFTEDFVCGPYRVVGVSRSWTVTRSWDDIWFESSRADQHYEFTLHDGPATWDAQVAVGADVDVLEIEDFLGGPLQVRFRNERFVVGVLHARDRSDSWRMVLGRSGAERTHAGLLTSGETTIQIIGTDRLTGTPIPVSDETGYLFEVDGEPVAAVQVINDGALWLASSLPRALREPVTAAAMALLLYRSRESP